jgi:hypothetical protein
LYVIAVNTAWARSHFMTTLMSPARRRNLIDGMEGRC